MDWEPLTVYGKSLNNRYIQLTCIRLLDIDQIGFGGLRMVDQWLQPLKRFSIAITCWERRLEYPQSQNYLFETDPSGVSNTKKNTAVPPTSQFHFCN